MLTTVSLEREAPALAKLDEAYPNLSEAVRLSINQLTDDLTSLSAKMASVEREVAASQNDSTSAKWVEAMSLFLGRAKMEVQKGQDSLNAVVAELNGLMRKYAADSGPAAPGADECIEFLMLFDQFVSDWKRAKADNAVLARLAVADQSRGAKQSRTRLEKAEKLRRLQSIKTLSKVDVAAQVDDVLSALRTHEMLNTRK